MNETAQIVSNILSELADECHIGQTGVFLEKKAEDLLTKYGATSFNKGYHPEWSSVPYPNILCVSPNGVIFHGIPDNYKFQDGDIVTLDIGLTKNGVCGDAALTVPIGEVSNATRRLLYYANQAVYELVDRIRPGVNTQDLATHLSQWAAQRGFTVNRRGAGHAIGSAMHMKPNIYNTPESVHEYTTLKEGQIFCIEPALTKSPDSMGVVLSDGWTIATLDRQYAAMFEHMVEVTADGCKVLTTHFDRAKH